MTHNSSNTRAAHRSDRQRTLLTLREAAAVVRAPEATLRYWRHLGIGPRSFKVGRRVMYDENDINRWIDAQRDNGEPAMSERRDQPI